MGVLGLVTGDSLTGYLSQRVFCTKTEESGKTNALEIGFCDFEQILRHAGVNL